MKHEKEHKEYIALLTFRMPTDHHWSTLPLQKQTTGVQSNRVKFHKNSKVVVIILKGNNEEQNSFYRNCVMISKHETYPSSRLSNSRVALSVSISHNTSPTLIWQKKKYQ